MAYRLEHHHHNHEQGAAKLTSPTDIYWDGETTLDIAWPCFYDIPHKPYHHTQRHRDAINHAGWPSPNFHDRSDQHPVGIFTYHEKLHPIHFLEEGYEEATILIRSANEKGVYTVYFDEECEIDDYIIRAHLSAENSLQPVADLHLLYTVKIRGENIMGREKVDTVVKGFITIDPSIRNIAISVGDTRL